MAQTKLKPVVLDMITDDDIESLRTPIGAHELKMKKIERLATQAYDQGALLSRLDLAVLLAITTHTVGECISEYHNLYNRSLPTRGILEHLVRATGCQAGYIENKEDKEFGIHFLPSSSVYIHQTPELVPPFACIGSDERGNENRNSVAGHPDPSTLTVQETDVATVFSDGSNGEHLGEYKGQPGQIQGEGQQGFLYVVEGDAPLTRWSRSTRRQRKPSMQMRFSNSSQSFFPTRIRNDCSRCLWLEEGTACYSATTEMQRFYTWVRKMRFPDSLRLQDHPVL